MLSRTYRYLVILGLLLGVTSICNAYPVIYGSELNKIKNTNRNHIEAAQSKTKDRTLPKEYEFILFYEPGCKHCFAFSPILKNYSANTGIKIISFIL